MPSGGHVMTPTDDELRALLNAPPQPSELKLTEEELNGARLTPTCIVRDLIYADVAAFPGPGGTGKTTLKLYEHVCIALKRPLYGLTVEKSGWCLFVTAEDRREQLAARLREIMRAMALTDEERRTVLDRVRFWDVTGESVKLVFAHDGNVQLTSTVDTIIAAYKADPPVSVVFDPIVSFGASEGMVNDNEQAIITACRRIVKAFDCHVQLIAHTGKGNAREKTLDQYSSRGGSALPDGCRMVSVLQIWDEESPHTPPSGCTPSPNSSITILARPKLSYAPPNLPLIWIKRTGFKFETFTEIKVTREENRRAIVDQVERFIVAELKAGRKHSRRTIESAIDSLTRAEIRKALDALSVQGRVVERDLPKAERVGQRKTYLSAGEFNCAEILPFTGAIPEKPMLEGDFHAC